MIQDTDGRSLSVGKGTLSTLYRYSLQDLLHMMHGAKGQGNCFCQPPLWLARFILPYQVGKDIRVLTHLHAEILHPHFHT